MDLLYNLTIQVALVAFICLTVAGGANNNHKCAKGLGLESGSVANSQIKVSENTSSAALGRLNNANGAWCFHYERVAGQDVTFTIDLQSIHIISGFQSQGPPRSQHPIEYLRYVGLEVQTSLNGLKWEDCCNGARMPFYADDRRDSSDVVATHSFGTLLTARFVRIVASTDVRWIGEAEKCFRFEVLGCDPTEVVPQIDFYSQSHPAGYLEAVWSQPQLEIAHGQLVSMPSKHYLVNISLEEDKDYFEGFNVSDTGLVLAKPQWAGQYTFSVFCTHHELSAVDCGQHKVKAIVSTRPACMSHSSDCSLDQRVQFVVPKTLYSVSHVNGSVEVKWTDSSMGWRSSNRKVGVRDEGNRLVTTSASGDNENRLVIHGLKASHLYKLYFAPQGSNIGPAVKKFSATLALLLDETDASIKHRAFIASVNLRASVLWSGRIHAYWDEAKANYFDSSSSSVKADRYVIVLKRVGDSEILEQSSVEGSRVVHDFGGIQASTEYEISLTCVFGKRQFDCGNTSIQSGQPLLVEESDTLAKIYVQSRVPQTWHNLEYSCRSSGGHLASLDSNDIEEALAYKTSLSDYWCGGNMCTDSPAPAHSMWSDGSAQTNTNFASDSGLDGLHCCVKVEVESGTNVSWWRGESCDTMLKGICEFDVQEYLDTPRDVFGKGISPTALNMSWATDGLYWQPTNYTINYCHLESLSRAALPLVGDKCGQITVAGNRGRHLVTVSYLEPFSEYDVTVTGHLEPYQKTTSTFAKARTLPKDDIEWIVTSDGILKVSWLQKIADYQENDRVWLRYQVRGQNESQVQEGTALQTTVGSLKFAETYDIYMIDKASKQEIGPIHIIAYPNCTIGVRQNMSCNYVSNRQWDFDTAPADCANKGLRSLPVESISLEQVSWPELASPPLVWVGSQMHRVGRDQPDLATVSQDYDSPAAYCQAWSTRQARFQSIPCDTKLPVFCQTDLLVEPPSPTRGNLKIRPGPTHMVLDWNVPPSGWLTTYTVTVTPAKPINRTRREERADNFTQGNHSTPKEPLEIEMVKTKPPINITDLLPETEYNLIITTSLNSKWKTTLNVDDVATTANNSGQPEEIIGFTMTNEEYKAAELSIFSILMVLVATAIVIFTISGTLPVYADNAVQVCFEISVLSCHIFILLAFLDGPLAWNPEDMTMCILAISCLAYFSLCAFTFLFLESLCIASVLVENMTLKLTQNIKLLVTIGFIWPLLYTVIVIPLLYKDLIPTKMRVCWLNLDNAASASVIIPISLLFFSTLIFLLISIFGKSSNESLQSSPTYTNRTDTLKQTRYIMLVITVLTGLGWSLGITSAHFQKDGLIITFLLTQLFLGISILFLRCLMDKQALRRFRRMCTDQLYTPKVNSISDSSIHVAKYTSPFGDSSSSEYRPATSRARSRTKQRTPFNHRSSSGHPSRPRTRKRPPTRDESTSTSGFQLFLSLPNTPDTEDPFRHLRSTQQVIQLAPGLGTESYI